MNIVILSGRIISEIEFNFIYSKDKKEKHTSIAMCKLQLKNGSVIDIYGYDQIADYLYRSSNKYICFEGRIDSNMMIEIENIVLQDDIFVDIWKKLQKVKKQNTP